MSLRSLERRIKALEVMRGVDEPVYDVVMSVGGETGLFGHSHWIVSSRQTVTKACSDEEELAIMLDHYEREDHRLWGKGDRVSFAEYLERFAYLGPDTLKVRQKKVIEALRVEGRVSLSPSELKRLIQNVLVSSME